MHEEHWNVINLALDIVAINKINYFARKV